MKYDKGNVEKAAYRWWYSPDLDTSYHSRYRRGSNQDHGAMHRNDGDEENEVLPSTGS